MAVALGAGLIIALLGGTGFSVYLFLSQDRYTLCLIVVALALVGLLSRSLELEWPPWILRRNALIAVILACAVILVAYVGTSVVFLNTPIAGDEILAEFDAAVFSTRQLAAPVPVQYQSVLTAMQPVFYLTIPGNAYWVSSYLPGNSALRALADVSIGSEWCSPLLAGVAILATFAVARCLWPDKPTAALLAVVMLATSPQVIVTAMTPFAMTAHLALNMTWLWLFVRDRPLTHAVAIALGFLATGLHQFVFHPLFVAPFGVLLLLQRRWILAGAYAVSYTRVYPVLGELSESRCRIIRHASCDRSLLFLYLLSWWESLVSDRSGHGQIASFGLFNMARLAAWLNPGMLLLFAVGLPVAFSGRPIERAILASVLSTTVAVAFILPMQGNGWGYRYVHGVLGCLAIVGVCGWVAISDGVKARIWTGGLASITLLTVFVIFPLNSFMAARMARPIADALDVIRSANKDVVVVDTTDIPLGFDLVRNRPDLSNRPKIVLLQLMDTSMMKILCHNKQVAVFDIRTARSLGMMTSTANPEMVSNEKFKLNEICHPLELQVN